MTTTAPDHTVATPAADPFRYGWRYMHHPRPEGGVAVEQVPLTLEDLLHPAEGDHVTHSLDHQLIRTYLVNVLRARLTHDRGAVVLDDVRVAWDVEDLKPHGPDIAVVFGVRERKNWSTFDVAEEGARPALLIEITSPETRQIDLLDKVEEYDLAGVPLYVIVDTHTRPGRIPRRVLGYRRAPAGHFEAITPDEQGRIWMEPVGLWIGFRADRIVCYDAEGAAIADYPAVAAARVEAEARATEAEARAIAEQSARAEAEARAAAAEERLRALEAELRRLRGA